MSFGCLPELQASRGLSGPDSLDLPDHSPHNAAQFLHDDAGMTDVRTTSFEASLGGALDALAERLCGQIEADIQNALTGLATGACHSRAAADARLATAAQLSESFTAGVSAARLEERQEWLAGLIRLLGAIRALDVCPSLSQLLDVLLAGAAREAGRAALLIVRRQHLRVWRVAGFGAQTSAAHLVDLPLDDSNVVGKAVHARQAVKTAPDIPAPPFVILAAERAGLALPLEIDQKVVAVLYADTMGEAPAQAPAAWPDLLEILARHTSRCLETMTAARLARQGGPRADGAEFASPRYRDAGRGPADRAAGAKKWAAGADYPGRARPLGDDTSRGAAQK